jgi:hypothetical protein
MTRKPNARWNSSRKLSSPRATCAPRCNWDPRQTLDAVLYSPDLAADLAESHREIIERLAGIRLEIQREGRPTPGPAVRSTPEFDLLLRIPAAQSDAQRRRLEKEIQRLEKLVASSQAQLDNEEFLRRAPAEVVASLREKLGRLQSSTGQESRGPRRPQSMMRFDVDHPEILEAVRRALAEDIGSGDITSQACVPIHVRAQGRFFAREPLVGWRASSCFP